MTTSTPFRQRLSYQRAGGQRCMITICHATGSNTSPYNEIKVSVNGLNSHGTHANDIIPAPASGCPTSALAIQNDKVTICHATGSQPILITRSQ